MTDIFLPEFQIRKTNFAKIILRFIWIVEIYPIFDGSQSLTL